MVHMIVTAQRLFVHCQVILYAMYHLFLKSVLELEASQC